MTTAVYNFPAANLDFRHIRDRTLKLINDKDKYILPEEHQSFEERIDLLLNEEFKELRHPTGQENFDTLARFIYKVAKEFRRCSHGNWKQVEPEVEALYRAPERIKRRRELQQPDDLNAFKQAIWWIGEQGKEEELELVRQVRAAPPFNTAEIAQLLMQTEQKVQKRVRESSTNPWISVCAHGIQYSRVDRGRVLSEILGASAGQTIDLKELALARNCQSIFRKAAVRRLMQLEPNPETIAFLRGLFVSDDPDGDLRASAYEAYLHLRSLNGVELTEAERKEEEQLSSSDPSHRMRWLLSLED